MLGSVARLLSFAALIVTGASLVGCADFYEHMAPPRRTMPTTISVTGRGEVTDEEQRDFREAAERRAQESEIARPREKRTVRRPGPNYPDWASRTLETTVSASLPEDANSRVEAVMLARRRARDMALQKLAEQVLNLPVAGDGSVGQFLKRNPDVAARMDQTVRSTMQVADAGVDDKNGVYRLTARLPLEPIATLGWSETVTIYPDSSARQELREAADSRQSSAVEEKVGRLAYDRAKEDAREKLRRELEGLHVRAGQTIGELMQTDQSVAKRAEDALAGARITDERRPKAGVCEIDMRLDVTPLLYTLR